MEQRLDLDYCPDCGFPTFDHEVVVLVRGEYFHRHCFEGSVRVTKRSQLMAYPFETN